MEARPKTSSRTSSSAVRRGLIWWFRQPANPFVSLNVAIDFAPARAYLEGLRGAGVTVQHLLAASLGRLLIEFPQANARVVAGRIRPIDGVGVAVPVNLLGHPGGRSRELSLAVLDRVDRKSLVEIAGASASAVKSERSGLASSATVRAALRVAEHAPDGLLERGLDLVDRVASNPWGAELAYRLLPASTALTNPGAAIGKSERLGEGIWFRGAAFQPPLRLLHLGTIWGASAVQEEVVVVDGKPAVRPILPVLFLFDHRLFDGVLAGRILLRLAELFRAPEVAFGNDGSRRP